MEYLGLWNPLIDRTCQLVRNMWIASMLSVYWIPWCLRAYPLSSMIPILPCFLGDMHLSLELLTPYPWHRTAARLSRASRLSPSVSYSTTIYPRNAFDIRPSWLRYTELTPIYGPVGSDIRNSWLRFTDQLASLYGLIRSAPRINWPRIWLISNTFFYSLSPV